MIPLPSGGGGDDQRPDALEVYIGTSRGASFGAWLDRGWVVYESFRSDYEGWEQHTLAPSRAQWRRFWQTVDELGVWGWHGRYERARPVGGETALREGVHWSVTLARGGRAVSSSGDDAGPGSVHLDDSQSFQAFLAAISRLLGGRPFR